MRICAAVTTFYREEALLASVRSLLDQSRPPDEVLVVDQTPSHAPETVAALNALVAAGKIRWIRFSPPSLPRARNVSLAAATSDVVLFVDDDALSPPDLIARHLDRYADPSVAGVAGQLYERPDDVSDEAFLARCQTEDGRRPFARMPRPGPARTTWWGANFSVRRDAAAAVDGLDEHFAVGPGEEEEFCLRLQKKGFRVVEAWEAWIVHRRLPGGTRLTTLSQTNVYFGRLLFFLRDKVLRRPRVFPWMWVARDLVTQLRRGPLHPDHLRRPWRLAVTLPKFAAAFVHALVCARHHKTGYARARGDLAAGRIQT